MTSKQFVTVSENHKLNFNYDWGAGRRTIENFALNSFYVVLTARVLVLVLVLGEQVVESLASVREKTIMRCTLFA